MSGLAVFPPGISSLPIDLKLFMKLPFYVFNTEMSKDRIRLSVIEVIVWLTRPTQFCLSDEFPVLLPPYLSVQVYGEQARSRQPVPAARRGSGKL
ncbi:hypothetical protein J6590_024663 [Homalodisca vitripennis]|nr:hypothetical protein J6590_024663 [Homalodisca vitripennis]